MKNILSFFLVTIYFVGIYGQELDDVIFPQDDIPPEDDQTGRIFYGYVAQPRQFPHMCSLLNRKTTGVYTLCGGSLISDYFLLTAAHCVNSVVSTTVGLGSVDRSRAYLQVQASKFYPHPQYNPSTLNNDIALWKMPYRVTFDAYVKAIRLPTVKQAGVTFEGATATVSGFGRYSASVSGSSQILRYVNVRIVPNRDCAVIYGSHVIVNSTVCALGLQYDEQGTCSGDSGSPLYVQEGTEKTQIAVTSFVSSKGCGSNRPTGYARTANHVFWISEVTGIPVRYS